MCAMDSAGPKSAAETRADESPQLWKRFQLRSQQAPASLAPSTPQGPKHPGVTGGGGGGRREEQRAAYRR